VEQASIASSIKIIISPKSDGRLAQRHASALMVQTPSMNNWWRGSAYDDE
jgi:hypothetical protein